MEYVVGCDCDDCEAIRDDSRACPVCEYDGDPFLLYGPGDESIAICAVCGYDGN